jgi:HSP20 family protein
MSLLRRVDPLFGDMWDFDRRMNDMLSRINNLESSLFPESSKTRTGAVAKESGFLSPNVDCRELEDRFQIVAEMPGLSKADIKVDLDEENRVLTLSGEQKKEKEEKGEKYYFKERVHGTYKRSFQLPDNVNMEQVKATMNNGLLQIDIPKVEKKQPVKRSIQINEQSQ